MELGRCGVVSEGPSQVGLPLPLPPPSGADGLPRPHCLPGPPRCSVSPSGPRSPLGAQPPSSLPRAPAPARHPQTRGSFLALFPLRPPPHATQALLPSLQGPRSPHFLGVTSIRLMLIALFRVFHSLREQWLSPPPLLLLPISVEPSQFKKLPSFESKDTQIYFYKPIKKRKWLSAISES